jgi:hypothetical protein
MDSSNFIQNLIPNHDDKNDKAPQVIIGTKNPFPNLPSTSQKYFFTDADADINKSDQLSSENLESNKHFQYGGPNRLGTQASYLPIPHHCISPCLQVNVPRLIPEAYAERDRMVKLPHPLLQKNDLAFTIRTNIPFSEIIEDDFPSMKKKQPFILFQTPMINLETLNYLLFGLQMNFFDHNKKSIEKNPWKDVIFNGLDLQKVFDRISYEDENQYMEEEVFHMPLGGDDQSDQALDRSKQEYLKRIMIRKGMFFVYTYIHN